MADLFRVSTAGSHGGSDLWVNPDHIVTAQPVRSDTGAKIVLDVELKLVGVNLFRARLGTFDDQAAADVAWQHFLEHTSQA